LKSTAAEAGNIFLWIGNRHAKKMTSTKKTKLANQRRIWFCSWVA
jgi:hypothetical protein